MNKKTDKNWKLHLRKIGYQKGNIPYSHLHPEILQRGEKHHNWKGDKVGYASLHEWIRSRLPKPKLCQDCKNNIPYDLCNISGKYKRDLSDWEWLCRKCHMVKDGRMEAFIKSGDPTGRKHKEETKKKMSVARRKYWETKKCKYGHDIKGKFVSPNGSSVLQTGILPIKDK